MHYQKTEYHKEPRLWERPETVRARVEEKRQVRDAAQTALANVAIAREEVLSLPVKGRLSVYEALCHREEELQRELAAAESAYRAEREAWEDSVWFFEK